MGWDTIESRRLVSERGSARELHYLPTRAEIAAECERIQRSWTQAETAKRRVCTPLPILFAELSPSESGLALDNEWRV